MESGSHFFLFCFIFFTPSLLQPFPFFAFPVAQPHSLETWLCRDERPEAHILLASIQCPSLPQYQGKRQDRIVYALELVRGVNVPRTRKTNIPVVGRMALKNNLLR